MSFRAKIILHILEKENNDSFYLQKYITIFCVRNISIIEMQSMSKYMYNHIFLNKRSINIYLLFAAVLEKKKKLINVLLEIIFKSL